MSSPALPADAEDAPPPRRRGMPGTIKSMLWSMIAVAAGCALWLAFTPRVSSVQHPVVDVAGLARESGASRHWDVAYAPSLPETWQPVNVRMLEFEGQKPTWQAGYDGPDGSYVAVLQTKGGDATWADVEVSHGHRVGEQVIDGVRWTRYNRDAKDQKSLVRSEPLGGLTTVVTGKGDWDKLATFAQALTPASKASAGRGAASGSPSSSSNK